MNLLTREWWLKECARDSSLDPSKVPVDYYVSIEREADAVECGCGGYAVRVEVTPEEEKQYGCGTPKCCSRAFVCKLCGRRTFGTAEAPEMGW